MKKREPVSRRNISGSGLHRETQAVEIYTI